MIVPANKLLALMMGLSAFQGRSLKMLDLANKVPVQELDAALALLIKLRDAIPELRAEQTIPDFNKDFDRLEKNITEALALDRVY